MSLAHAGRAEEDDIFSIFQKTHGGQLLDLSLINGGLETEIKVLQRLFDGEAQHLYLFFIGPSAVSYTHLAFRLIPLLSAWAFAVSFIPLDVYKRKGFDRAVMQTVYFFHGKFL